MKYRIDPDLKTLLPFKFKRHSTLTRHLMNAFFKVSFQLTKPKLPYVRKTLTINSHDGEAFTCYHYYKEHHQNKPLLIYIHGGGFQNEGTSIHQQMIIRFVEKSNLQVIYVKYRLLPEYPYPKAFEDVVSAYDHLLKHQQIFTYTDLYVGGDSAGGNLAFALALYDRDQKRSHIKKTMLIYPVLTKHHQLSSHLTHQMTPMWNQHLNQKMWEAYLKNVKNDQYASLLEHDMHGLGSVYIETAEFDPLRDEGLLLEKKLTKQGIDVIAFHTSKTVHGYDALPHANITQQMMLQRIAFLKGDS